MTNRLLLLCLLAWISLASCTGKSGKIDGNNPEKGLQDSIRDITEVISKDPKNPDNYTLRAQMHFRDGKSEDAMNDLNLSIQLDSSRADNYLLMAEYALLQGKSEISKKALDQCLKFNPDNEDAKMKLAALYLYVKKYKEAMVLLSECLRANPQLAHAYYLKAVIYMEMGDTAQSVYNLQESVNKVPDYSSYVLLGKLYAAKKDSLALDFYRLALKQQPQSIEAYYGIGMFYQKVENYPAAIQSYMDLIENADPEYVEAYYNIGYIYLEYSADNEKAVEYFTKAIEKRSNYYQAYHNRAVAYELLKQYDLARKDYQTALNILPNYQLSVDGLNRLDKLNHP